MKRYKLSDTIGGWFVGNFTESIYQTKDFEVGLKLHKKNEYWQPHKHNHMVEITLVINGKMKLQNQIFQDGDIFLLEKGEIADPVFLEDTLVCVVKTPSIIGDKELL